MTGFGRGEHADSQVSYQVELGSVNRKQADVSVGIPRRLADLEPAVRKRMLSRISRGRVNVTITVQALSTGKQTIGLRVDHALARSYLLGLRQVVSEDKDIRLEISAGDLLQAPGVFELEEHEINPEAAWQGIRTALDQAIDQLIATRETEGKHLQEDLEQRVTSLEKETTAAIAGLAPKVVEHHRKHLAKRLAEAGLPLPLDDERLIREIALFAEKSDITEELTRLDSHITKFRQLIASTEPSGRSLDFYAQELFRELNTIGSKAHNAAITQLVVNGKAEVEKIREQVQNIE